MVAAYVGDLRRALSSGRLERYRPKGGDDLAMAAHYVWNMELCRELYQPLGALEVVLRNAVHETLRRHYGMDDWYDHGGANPKAPALLKNEEQSVDTAKKEIRRDKKREIAQGIDPVTPGRVIAALRFGFWTSLLDSAYGTSPKGPQFWTPTNGLLTQVLPHAGTYYTEHRGRVHRRFNDLRILRNRVFHYEPICYGIALEGGRFVPLTDLHTQLIEAIGWASPTLQRTVQHFDRFIHIHQHGQRAIRNQLRRHLGI